MNSLEESLLRIARILKANKIPYMVIGGVANLFWGVPRATLDIDITIQVPEDSQTVLITKMKRNYKLRISNPISFVQRTNVLPLEDKSGVRVDLIFAKLPYEIKAIRRSKRMRIHGESVQICSPEDLVVHKIISDRPKDREDVRGIISSVGKKLNRRYLDPIIKELAKELVRPEILKYYHSCFS